jgi:hypothetical protein
MTLSIGLVSGNERHFVDIREITEEAAIRRRNNQGKLVN